MLKSAIEQKIQDEEAFYSFELTPSISHKKFLEDTKSTAPLFYALNCRKKTKFELFPWELKQCTPCNILLHLTLSIYSSKREVEDILIKALENGVNNVFLLKGDGPINSSEFSCTSDLVRYVKNQFGDKFSICVAGYPETHSEFHSNADDLEYLKSKVTAGADFIITQFFLSSDLFNNFVRRCQDSDIRIPILAGILPFSSIHELREISGQCKVDVPQNIINDLLPIQHSREMMRDYGVNFTANLLKKLLKEKATYGFHLFTLNNGSLIYDVLKQVADFSIEK